jgi:uncharacterized protein (TIGR02452 family)
MLRRKSRQPSAAQDGPSNKEEPKPKPSFWSRRTGGKESLVDIADSTLERLKKGSYRANDVDYDLSKAIKNMEAKTKFYAADSDLSKWHSAAPASASEDETRPEVKITVTECSTLVGARTLKETLISAQEDAKIGVLNFASAKNPGGGFLTGAQAQVCRSSLFRISPLTYVHYFKGRIYCSVLDDIS